MTPTQRLVLESIKLGRDNPHGKDTPHLLLKRVELELKAGRIDSAIAALLKSLEGVKMPLDVRSQCVEVSRYLR